jgi:uncharacterized protein YecE (DUF72 family)
LTNYLVGTGGWAYFNVDNRPSLQAYSRVFNFVEVNYTFYDYPSIKTVEKWRSSVPQGFVFAVRCHRDLTHNIGLKPICDAYDVFYAMRQYCDALNSPYLILETPASYNVANYQNMKEVKAFFSNLNLDGLKIVWEYRAQTTPAIINLMQEFNIIQCVDLSKQAPSYNLDVTYSRLFGKGQHNIYQFTDDELLDIQKNAEKTDSKKVILSYHGSRMFTDALRFKTHLATGNYPPATSTQGIESAKAVLSEDAHFPTSKNQLIKHQGWKVIDTNQNKTAHLSKYLEKIPEKTYNNITDVLEALEVFF